MKIPSYLLVTLFHFGKIEKMKKGNALSVDEDSAYYNWTDDNYAHYFKYEPIKWRVQKLSNKKGLLLSDVVLDNQQYNTGYGDTTWEESFIRSWLNSYGSDYNREKTDYSYAGTIYTDGTMEKAVR